MEIANVAQVANVPNIYYPYLTRIVDIVDETDDIRTFRLQFSNLPSGEKFKFRAGQFGLYSVFGYGEAVFCIASSPTREQYIECSFKKVGKVTSALRRLEVGDVVGFRGPYGNYFPLEDMVGSNLIFIGGGIGLAPLRSLIDNVLDLRSQFRDISILYGARSIKDLIYQEQLCEWSQRGDIDLVQTVDSLPATSTWKGKVGLIPQVLTTMNPSPENSWAIVCGPPIMIKYSIEVLRKLHFPANRIVTTLENRMKCGFGKCGRCNIGKTYVCKEGPVFRADELQNLPESDF
ncbi:MAG: FAD/NAD(P)-binding protein [Oligoflexia bacterium]|nr:FAD/NAD(P)-binding protein [Oligoflexia bacterium]